MSCVHATVYQGPGGQAVPALRQQQRAGGGIYLQQQRGTAGRHPAAPQTPALQAQQQNPGQRQPWKPGYVSASVQGGTTRWEKPICAPPRLSEVSPTLPY